MVLRIAPDVVLSLLLIYADVLRQRKARQTKRQQRQTKSAKRKRTSMRNSPGNLIFVHCGTWKLWVCLC